MLRWSFPSVGSIQSTINKSNFYLLNPTDSQRMTWRICLYFKNCMSFLHTEEIKQKTFALYQRAQGGEIPGWPWSSAARRAVDLGGRGSAASETFSNLPVSLFHHGGSVSEWNVFKGLFHHGIQQNVSLSNTIAQVNVLTHKFLFNHIDHDPEHCNTVCMFKIRN